MVALDVNPAMLAVARALPTPAGATIAWLEGNAISLDLPDDTFDLVLCQQGLQFFKGSVGQLSKRYATLRPRGRTRISDVGMFSYLRQCSASGWTRSKRPGMFTVIRRKTFTMLAILLVCALAAAILECELHTESSADEHATPVGHHHSASPHMTGRMACLIAVLPTAMFLVWFACMWLPISCRFVRLTPYVFLPFIPPKTVLH